MPSGPSVDLYEPRACEAYAFFRKAGSVLGLPERSHLTAGRRQ